MPKILPPPVPVWTLLLFLAFAGDAQVRITEFMASNTSSIADEDGAFSDWIEIQNTTATNVNLLNWALTDSAGNASKWLFPATNLAPGNFLLVFASGKDRRIAGLPGKNLVKVSCFIRATMSKVHGLLEDLKHALTPSLSHTHSRTLT